MKHGYGVKTAPDVVYAGQYDSDNQQGLGVTYSNRGTFVALH